MKKIVKYLTLTALLGTLAGCEKVLDVSPVDVIDQNKAFTNVADLESGVIGAYSAVIGGAPIEIASRSSDELRLSSENRGQGVQMHNWQYVSTTGETNGWWNVNYVLIDRVNKVMEAAARIQPTTAEQGTYDRIRGECLALRAMGHFNLVVGFAPAYNATALAVPYMTKSGITLPARQTTQEVYTAIKADLQQAKTLIPASFGPADLSRISRTAVAALQARVALYERNWADANTFANEALTARPLDSITDHPRIWTDATSNGVIFRLRRVLGDERLGSLFTDINGDAFFHPSDALRSAYDATNDVRAAIATRTSNRGTGKDPETVAKYVGVATINLADVKAIRSAEMLLIRAEAAAEAGNLAAATTDINTLRRARIRSYSDETFSTKAAAMDAIELERRRELAYEGHRFFDLKRWGKSITRAGRDALLAAASARNLPANDNKFTWPIPQAEIDANKNISQNPGY
jgi:starch-binding outer membrane protein, SusD/RagB family